MKDCRDCMNVKETSYLMGMRDVSQIECTGCQVAEVEKRTIPSLITEAHETARSKGWWDASRPIIECLALVHCEVSEAIEAYRKGSTDGIVEELADVLIRVFDLCGAYGWDLESAVRRKMAFNKTRPYRHGGKLA